MEDRQIGKTVQVTPEQFAVLDSCSKELSSLRSRVKELEDAIEVFCLEYDNPPLNYDFKGAVTRLRSALSEGKEEGK